MVPAARDLWGWVGSHCPCGNSMGEGALTHLAAASREDAHIAGTSGIPKAHRPCSPHNVQPQAHDQCSMRPQAPLRLGSSGLHDLLRFLPILHFCGPTLIICTSGHRHKICICNVTFVLQMIPEGLT